MNIKSISRICGILYVSTVPAFLVSNLFMKEQLVNADNILNTFKLLAENAFQYRLAVSIDFLAMVAVMALVFSLFAILKPVHPYLALLALGLRIGEVVIQAASKIPEYLLLQLSQTAPSSGGGVGGVAAMEQLGRMLIAGSTQALWVSFVFLGIGSLFNNFLFYRSKGIPGALAIFGLISAALYALGSVAALMIDLPEIAKMGMMLPMVLFELTLGFYLAIFGMQEKTT
jgi:xanthosine utilization system XapX-like protein